jgi:hypothetical protein
MEVETQPIKLKQNIMKQENRGGKTIKRRL